MFVISDLHANLEPLSALPRDYDELWVLGDLVNYGPNPAEIIDFVHSHTSMVIRGNHDQSVGFGAERGCSPRFRAMAEATRDYTSSVLSVADKQFLRNLPTRACRQVDGQALFLCHATPSDPLYEYRPPGSPLWERDEGAGASECCSRGPHPSAVRAPARQADGGQSRKPRTVQGWRSAGTIRGRIRPECGEPRVPRR
jgi:protein phosphatase